MNAASESCRRCGGPNVTWSAASPLWNYVMRGNDINGTPRFRDLVCIPCFILCAIEAGLPASGWRLTLVPEPDGLIYETPSGRMWDAARFLWVEPVGGGARGLDPYGPECVFDATGCKHFEHRHGEPAPDADREAGERP